MGNRGRAEPGAGGQIDSAVRRTKGPAALSEPCRLPCPLSTAFPPAAPGGQRGWVERRARRGAGAGLRRGGAAGASGGDVAVCDPAAGALARLLPRGEQVQGGGVGRGRQRRVRRASRVFVHHNRGAQPILLAANRRIIVPAAAATQLRMAPLAPPHHQDRRKSHCIKEREGAAASVCARGASRADRSAAAP